MGSAAVFQDGQEFGQAFIIFGFRARLIAAGKKDGSKDVSGRGGHDQLFRDIPDFLLLTAVGGEESSEECDRGDVEADLANSVNYLPGLGRIDDVTIEVDFEAIKILLGGPLGD
jgi:hypothetical protein